MKNLLMLVISLFVQFPACLLAVPTLVEIQSPTTAHIAKIEGFSTQTVWICSDQTYHTVDSGISWMPLAIGDFDAISDSEAWIWHYVRPNVYFNYTSDHGLTWTTASYLLDTSQVYTEYLAEPPRFFDAQNGWFGIGRAGGGQPGGIEFLLQTRDGGKTWNYSLGLDHWGIDTGLNVPFWDFSSPDLIWLIERYWDANDPRFNNDRLWSSKGITFMASYFLDKLLEPFQYAHIFDEQTGLLRAANIWLLTTQDGGASWDTTQITSDTAILPGSWQFHNARNGWAYHVTDGSTVFYFSGDLGRSWQSRFTVPAEATGFAVFGPDQLWIGCKNGRIFRYADPLNIETDDPENQASPSRLTQNYPNPFTQSTNISWTLPKSQKVVIRIYNAAGQWIRTLVDNSLAEGRHSLTWDGRDDAGDPTGSGIYFYAMSVNGKPIETRRMVLMR